MFSGFVQCANPIKFYARRDKQTQFLACEFVYKSTAVTALTIPLPVASGDLERSIKEVPLAVYRDFFKDLGRLFRATPQKLVQYAEYVDPKLLICSSVAELEKVHSSIQISPEFWGQLTQYSDGGFMLAVLPNTDGVFKATYPFAFSFESRLPGQSLKYPTLQLRQCSIQAAVQFSYELYYQGTRRLIWDCPGTHDVEESMDLKRCRPLLSSGPVYCRTLSGKHPNSDVIL